MGRRIDLSWWIHWATSRSSQCSTTGVTKDITDTGNVSIYIHIVDINIRCMPRNTAPYSTIAAFGATRKEMFYLTTHSTHFILRLYGVGHMVKDHSDSERGNPLPPHGLLFPIKRLLLYAPSHRQDNTYHGLCYTSCEALAGTRYSSMGPPHEGSIRRPIAPWADVLTTDLHLAHWGYKWHREPFNLHIHYGFKKYYSTSPLK